MLPLLLMLLLLCNLQFEQLSAQSLMIVLVCFYFGSHATRRTIILNNFHPLDLAHNSIGLERRKERPLCCVSANAFACKQVVANANRLDPSGSIRRRFYIDQPAHCAGPPPSVLLLRRSSYYHYYHYNS